MTGTLFDMAAFVARAGDDDALAHELLGDFVRMAAESGHAMRAARERNDHRELARLAHRIRGPLLSLGAAISAEKARILEDAAHARDDARCANALGGLLAALDDLVADIDQVTATSGPARASGTHGA